MITLRPHQTRAIESMNKREKGQIIVPTGGGKTMIMIHHAMQKFARNEKFAHTVIVVAPRIMLAQQLCTEFTNQIDDVDVCLLYTSDAADE